MAKGGRMIDNATRTGDTQDAAARREVAEWLDAQIEGASEVDLPTLVDEAAEHFLERYLDTAESFLDRFPYILRSFIYQIGTQVIAKKRPDSFALEMVFGDDDTAFLGSLSTPLANRWLEHVNGRYVAFAELGADELMAAAEERENRIASELEMVDQMKASARKLRNGEKVKAHLNVDLSPKAEEEHHQAAKNDLYERLVDMNPSECTDFCWYCGTILPDYEKDHSHDGPVCPKCDVVWARAYAVDCPSCGEGAFVHLHQPATVDLSVDLKSVQRVAGSCWCDSCSEPYSYNWETRNEGHSSSPYLAEVARTLDPEVTLISIASAAFKGGIDGLARKVVAPDS